MRGEKGDLKEKALRFRDLVGDDLFRFTISQNLISMEKVRRKFEQLALAILEYFDCERCCKCCREMPIHLNDEDMERLGRIDGEALFDKMDEREVDNYLKTPCPYLKGNACTVYESRPMSCRIFPFVVIRPVPTLQLCPMGEKVFEEYKRLAWKYGKKDVKVEWDESASDNRLLDYSGSGGGEKKAVYVALPIGVLEKFLRYLRTEKEGGKPKH
ncbi:MAG: YkgJ family cysteine cluster protein [Candidatus Methanospirareceae archaeon]